MRLIRAVQLLHTQLCQAVYQDPLQNLAEHATTSIDVWTGFTRLMRGGAAAQEGKGEDIRQAGRP
jgi:hypothetical protein